MHSDNLKCRKGASADHLQKVVCHGIQSGSIHIVVVGGLIGTDSHARVHDDALQSPTDD